VSVEQASDLVEQIHWPQWHNIVSKPLGVGPLKQLLKKFGFNPENVVAAAKSQMRAPEHAE